MSYKLYRRIENGERRFATMPLCSLPSMAPSNVMLLSPTAALTKFRSYFSFGSWCSMTRRPLSGCVAPFHFDRWTFRIQVPPIFATSAADRTEKHRTANARNRLILPVRGNWRRNATEFPSAGRRPAAARGPTPGPAPTTSGSPDLPCSPNQIASRRKAPDRPD